MGISISYCNELQFFFTAVYKPVLVFITVLLLKHHFNASYIYELEHDVKLVSLVAVLQVKPFDSRDCAFAGKQILVVLCWFTDAVCFRFRSVELVSLCRYCRPFLKAMSHKVVLKEKRPQVLLFFYWVSTSKSSDCNRKPHTCSSYDEQ